MPKQKYNLKTTMPEEPGGLVQAGTTIGAALGTATKKVEIAVGRYEPTAAAKKRLPRKVKKLAKQVAAKKAAAAAAK